MGNDSSGWTTGWPVNSHLHFKPIKVAWETGWKIEMNASVSFWLTRFNWLIRLTTQANSRHALATGHSTPIRMQYTVQYAAYSGGADPSQSQRMLRMSIQLTQEALSGNKISKGLGYFSISGQHRGFFLKQQAETWVISNVLCKFWTKPG